MNEAESLYDWCTETGHESILEAWDYEKNPDTPKDIKRSFRKERYFFCPTCGKPYKRKIVNLVKYGEVTPCPHCRSFGQWCIDHERRDLLQRWDYEKNKCSPFDIFTGGDGKYYFKCPKGIHESELKQIRNITTNFTKCKCTECESFGQWGIDNIGPDFIEKYWSEKNTDDPMKIFKSAKRKVWIKCQETDYHQDYAVSCYHFVQGRRCPYCAGKLVDPKDSLGEKYPESQNFWFQKNLTPFQVLPMSSKKVYWECPTHGLYRRTVYNAVIEGFKCPKCVAEKRESSYEENVHNYLEKLFGSKDIKCENDCSIKPKNPKTGHSLRYDNEVVSLKLIIQVNGEQHYKPVEYYTKKNVDPNEFFEYRKWLDKYKKEYALNHEYNYLVIPYWEFDKENTWKKSIDEKIKEIKGK